MKKMWVERLGRANFEPIRPPGLSAAPRMITLNGMAKPFDPDLLYVECGQCGLPILWQPGQTARILAQAGIDTAALDERCLLVSQGCPACRPDESEFTTQVVRLAKERDASLRPHKGAD